MAIFKKAKKKKGIFKRDDYITSLLLDQQDIDLIEVNSDLDSLENTTSFTSEIFSSDIENFFSKVPEVKESTFFNQEILESILEKGQVSSNYDEIPCYSEFIEFEFERYLIRKYEYELREYLVRKLQFRYLKSLRKSIRIYFSKKTPLEIPLIFQLSEYIDNIENIKKEKQFFLFLNNSFSLARAFLNNIINENTIQNRNFMLSG